jgi:putative transcriptional regulator
VLDCQPGDILEYVPDDANDALESGAARRKSA